MKKILVIEDDKIKIEKLNLLLDSYNLTIKESYHGGLKEILDNYNSYSLLILDMTIPLWEKNNSDLDGNFEQFGGEKILREMKRRKKLIPTVLFTMFDIFPSVPDNLTFDQLTLHLKEQFEDFFLGGIFFNSSEDNWKIELTKYLSKI